MLDKILGFYDGHKYLNESLVWKATWQKVLFSKQKRWLRVGEKVWKTDGCYRLIGRGTLWIDQQRKNRWLRPEIVWLPMKQFLQSFSFF